MGGQIGIRQVRADALNNFEIKEPPQLEDIPGLIDALDKFFIGIDTGMKHYNGKNLDQQRQQLATINVYKLLQIIARIEEENWSSAKVCCKHGFHRSVGLAEMIRNHFYQHSPNVQHLDLHHPRNVHDHEGPRLWPSVRGPF